MDRNNLNYPLLGQRSIPALPAGNQTGSNGSVTLTVPSWIDAGTYYLVGCVDLYEDVPETDYTNNCVVSKGTTEFEKPNLVETFLSSTDTAVPNIKSPSAARPQPFRFHYRRSEQSGPGGFGRHDDHLFSFSHNQQK